MQANATLNLEQSTNIHTAELSWGEAVQDDVPVKETALILAADCVYFEVCLIQSPKPASIGEHC